MNSKLSPILEVLHRHASKKMINDLFKSINGYCRAYMKDISRVKRSKKRAEEHYDKISGYYDYLEGLFEKKYRDHALSMLNIERKDKVLEIGPGTGHALKRISETTGSEGYVCGIDISREMLLISKSRLKNNDLFQNSSLIQGDGSNLPIKDNFLDHCFLSFTLELFDTPDIEKALSEIKRVLKDDGKVSIVSLAKKENITVKIYESFHKLFPNAIDCRPIPVSKFLEENGFEIKFSDTDNMMGLPIKIVIGKK
ncbi:MAG: class I SAM-dependent methyltransferase [Thermoplasmatota archaeon]